MNQFDFNKYNADNFVHDTWQKYSGNIGWLLNQKLRFSPKTFAFNQWVSKVNIHKAT